MAKEVLDRVGAVVLLVVLLPAYAGIAAAVAIGSRREGVLFRQRRIGRHGREFVLLKFRTMTGNPADVGEADAHWAARVTGVRQRHEGFDRQTPLGRVLRRTRLDELPQLLNVLRGDMSLVGPRPERSSYVPLFEDAVPGYRDRRRVKPGITGLAQVQGLVGETSIVARVDEDNFYIDNWNLWLDLKILLRTVPAVVSNRMEVDLAMEAPAAEAPAPAVAS